MSPYSIILNPFHGNLLDHVWSSLALAFGMTNPEYQVGAHFKALDECVLVAAMILTGYLYNFNFIGDLFHPFIPIDIFPLFKCLHLGNLSGRNDMFTTVNRC